MHRRVHVAEIPLICWNLTVWVGVKVPQHQQELLFTEVEVYEGKRERMKRQIPCRIPRVFPFVGHGNDIVVKHVEPLSISSAEFARPRKRMRVVFSKPVIKVKIVILLSPQH